MATSGNETGDRIRVALIDDYEVVVLGLARMLAGYQDRVEIVELDAMTPVVQEVDIALVDTFAMDQDSGVSVQTLVRNPRIGSVVLFTWTQDPESTEKFVRQGVRGVVCKAVPARELVETLERVHAGESVVAAQPEHGMPDSGDWPGRAEGLTSRESEVIALITQGRSNNEIAEQAFLSINTVKSYIRTAYRKMGVTSRSQAVLWGVSHGFLPDRQRLSADDIRPLD